MIDVDAAELRELNTAEVRVLARYIRLFVRSDGDLSAGERELIGRIAGDAGTETFWQAMDDAAQSDDNDRSSILRDAEKIDNKSAQELIYGTLYELSIADGTNADENQLLAELAACWQLEIREI